MKKIQKNNNFNQGEKNMNELLEMIKRCDASEVNEAAKEPEVVYDDLERVIAESRDAFTASESTELLHVYLLYEPVTGKTYGLLDYGRYPIDTAAIMFGKGVVIIDVMSQHFSPVDTAKIILEKAVASIKEDVSAAMESCEHPILMTGTSGCGVHVGYDLVEQCEVTVTGYKTYKDTARITRVRNGVVSETELISLNDGEYSVIFPSDEVADMCGLYLPTDCHIRTAYDEWLKRPGKVAEPEVLAYCENRGNEKEAYTRALRIVNMDRNGFIEHISDGMYIGLLEKCLERYEKGVLLGVPEETHKYQLNDLEKLLEETTLLKGRRGFI